MQLILSLEEFYFIPVFLGAGIAFYFNQDIFFLGLMIGFMSLISFFIKVNTHRFFKTLGLFFLVFCLGYGWISLRTHYLHTSFVQEPLYSVDLVGRIESIETISSHYAFAKRDSQHSLAHASKQFEQEGLKDQIKTPIKVKRAVIHILKSPLSHKIQTLKKVRLRLEENTQLEPGQVIHFCANLRPIGDKITPYSFDFKRDAFYKGINAVGVIKKISYCEAPKRKSFERLRHKIATRLRTKMKSEAKELAVALTVGDKNGIPKDIRNYFADTGTSHILVIAGLHLSIIGLFLISLLQRVTSLFPILHERFPMHKVNLCLAWFFLLFYNLISGSAYPVQRAFIMISLMILGVLIDRRTISLYSLCLAAFFIMILSPESVISVSFQLSFAAVLPLVALYEKHQFPSWLSPIVTTITASLGTLPFCIVVFRYTTLHAITGNLLVVPFFAYLVMPFMLLSFFGWGLSILEFLLNVMIAMVKFISHFKGAHIDIASPSGPYFIFLFVTGGLILCLIQSRLRFSGLPLILLSPLFYCPVHAPDRLESADGKVKAWRVEKNMFQTKSYNRFILDEWERVYAIKIQYNQDDPGAKDEAL